MVRGLAQITDGKCVTVVLDGKTGTVGSICGQNAAKSNQVAKGSIVWIGLYHPLSQKDKNRVRQRLLVVRNMWQLSDRPRLAERPAASAVVLQSARLNLPERRSEGVTKLRPGSLGNETARCVTA